MKQSDRAIYDISRNIIVAVQETFLMGEIEGRQNVPASGPCIIAANHASHFDPPLVGAPFRRHINYFARKSLWAGRIACWWLDSVGTIPIDRDGDSDISAMRRTLEALRGGGLLTLFPEGTRSKDGSLQTAKPGIGLIAARSQATVVPCRVFNSHKVLPREARLPRLNIRVDVTYGAPLIAEDYDPGREAGKERYQLIADRIMAAIARLERPRPEAV